MVNKNQQGRREFLRFTGAAAAVSTVAGCLGGSGDVIRYISRGGTTHDAERELFDEWSEESGVTVEHQEVADDTEMMNVISENPGEIDFTNPSSWGFAYNNFEFDGELLADIDVGEIPNYDIVQDEWQEAPLVKDNPKGIFYYVSTQGVGYNTEEVGEITSWDDLKDSEYEDQITLFDSGPARFGNACAALGYDPEEAAQDDGMFEDVIDEIEEQDANVFNYWTTGDEFMRLLREERAAIASAWGGRVRVLAEDGNPLEYTHTEDGCVTWSNAFSICEESENKDTVYDLLDWVYQRENLEQVNTTHNYPTPVEDPSEEVQNLPDYTDDPDDLTWIDWSALMPKYEDLEQRLAEIKSS